MNTRSLLLKLSKRFPKHLAKMNHDFVGLMCGKLPLEVNSVLLCLDFDEEVYEIVKDNPVDLIITHHPFIYGSKAKVLKYDLKKKELFEKIEALKIPVYSMHTNFDSGEGGMNDALANRLELENIYSPVENIMMRVGDLKQEMNIEDFAKYAKEKFDVDYGLLLNYGSPTVKKVAIIGGGGSRSYETAQLIGADIYISGDVPHHVRRSIIRDKYNYLDLPHEIEKIFMPTMRDLLLSWDKDLKIICVDHEKLPKVI